MDITKYAPPNPNEVKKVESGSKGGLLGMDDVGQFMKIFVAQMENQDPLKPTDGTEFFSQTAQITMVEQLLEVNKKNDALQATMEGLGRSLTSVYLGKNVIAKVTDADGKETDVSGTVSQLSFDKDGKALLGLDNGEVVALADVVNVNIISSTATN